MYYLFNTFCTQHLEGDLHLQHPVLNEYQDFQNLGETALDL